MKKYLFMVCILSQICCEKDLITKTIDFKEDTSWLARYKLLNCPTYDQITNTTWDLNGFMLFHTDGLRQMALSGIVDRLNEEYCNFGLYDNNIPGGMGDFQEVGYSESLNFNGWLIAKYTSTEPYPDNWIHYHISDGYWERWDLAENEPGEPKPFLLSNSIE